MKDFLLSMFTAALYAVFMQNLVFSGGFGANEVIRMAQKNGGILPVAGIISAFSVISVAISRLLTDFVPNLQSLPTAWLAGLYGGVLLLLFLFVCGLISLLRFKARRYLLKLMGMAALNTLVMATPLLTRSLGETTPQAIAVGLSSGIAFAGVSLLINSGIHHLQRNKAIPAMFSGVPAVLIYTGLLALAFTGFQGVTLAGR
jgi:Na+-translocating ferredoxin:NAD+ oxidoreductase RnfA subunit